MTIGSNGTPSEKNARVVVARSPAQQEGKLKLIAGSASDDWNNVLANPLLARSGHSRSSRPSQHLTQSGSVKALPNPERKRDQLRSVDARVWENRSTT